MLDDFREQASSSSLFEEEDTPSEAKDRREGSFLGMSPAQRFVVALLLLLITCLVGTFFLLATGRVVPPF